MIHEIEKKKIIIKLNLEANQVREWVIGRERAGGSREGSEGPAPLFWVKRNLKRNKNRQGKQKKTRLFPLAQSLKVCIFHWRCVQTYEKKRKRGDIVSHQKYRFMNIPSLPPQKEGYSSEYSSVQKS